MRHEIEFILPQFFCIIEVMRSHAVIVDAILTRVSVQRTLFNLGFRFPGRKVNKPIFPRNIPNTEDCCVIHQRVAKITRQQAESTGQGQTNIATNKKFLDPVHRSTCTPSTAGFLSFDTIMNRILPPAWRGDGNGKTMQCNAMQTKLDQSHDASPAGFYPVATVAYACRESNYRL